MPNVNEGLKIIGLMKRNQLYGKMNLETVDLNKSSDHHFILYNVKNIYELVKKIGIGSSFP